ncbi:MAG: hypothetical protein AB8F78_03810 [Saprospiraceae bacterium]
MRIFTLLFLSVAFMATSCSSPETSTVETEAPQRSVFVPETLIDSIAFVHGFDYWQDVQQIDFRFDIDINGEGKLQREWSWFPKTDSVVRTLEGVTESIVRNTSIDSTDLSIDGQFINDSYWLLMPYYLVWSKDGYTSVIDRNATSPMTDEQRTKLTVQYGSDGGYTPGDAYDLYVDASYQLKEWTFRKGGQTEASMTMDWSDYRTIENLVLPADHKGKDVLRIYHPVVRVITAK